MTTPEILVLTEADGVDRYLFEDVIEANAKWSDTRIPRLFADATATIPVIVEWVRELVRRSVTDRRHGDPIIRTGPSLLLKGLVGRGKTHQAIGAVRALAASGAHCRWEFVYEPDLFAQMRPRSGFDPEEVFEKYAGADLLVLDDMGREPRSDWVSSQHGRLIDRRNREMLPTLITTNVRPTRFGEVFGDQIVSRLVEMCREVQIEGPDRRREVGNV